MKEYKKANYLGIFKMPFNWTIITTVLILAAISSLGGFFIASSSGRLFEKWKYKLIGLGTGVLFGVTFLEFLPHAMESHPDISPLLIISGLILIVFVETVIAPKLNFLENDHCKHDHAKEHDHKQNPHHEHQHHLVSHQAACSAVGCLIVCSFFDGLEIATAFRLSSKTGLLTGFGLLLHILPDGILAASLALAGGASPVRAKLIVLINGTVLVSGALVSIFLFSVSFHYIIPLATGILIYVCLVHLLPVAVRKRNGYWWLLFGLLFFMIFKHHS